MKPIVMINFKTYKEAAGNKSLALAKSLSKVKSSKYTIIISPSLLTLKEIVQKTNMRVFAQHLDPLELGSHTGHIPIQELKDIGVRGTILNHSEHKLPFNILKKTVEMCKKHKFKTVVCASNIGEVKKIAKLHPTYIAYEPKALIGGNVSVTDAKPKIIRKAVEIVAKVSSKTGVLVGAGVHSKEDLGQALVLGAQGVLIGHAVPQAKNPAKFLKEMLM